MANSITVGSTLSTTWTRKDPNAYTTYTFLLETTLISQSVANNTSTINVKLSMKTNYNGETAFSGGNWATFYTYIASNGGSYSQLGYKALGEFTGSTSYVQLISTNYDLTHNSDGTATYSVKGKNVRGSNQNYQPQDGEGEITNISLPTIARFPKI